MEIPPINLSEQELRHQYAERRAATPDILDQVRRTVEVEGHQYEIEAFSINPYPLHGVSTDTWESPPIPLTEALLQQFYITQSDPHSYVGIMSRLREEGDKTYIRMYGTTLSNHDYLAGSMYDIGVPMEEVTAANNNGLAIPFAGSDPLAAFVRYKFDMDKNRNHRYYHIWVHRPQHRDREEVLQLRARLVRASHALDLIIPEMAARMLKVDPSKQSVETTVTGNILMEHNLELKEFTPSS